MRTRPGTRTVLSEIRKEVLSFREKVEEFLRLFPPTGEEEVVFYFLMPSPSSSDDEEENGLTA